MQLLLYALIAGSLGALVAGSLALVYGVLGVFNLALGQLALIGGYTAWWLSERAHLPLTLSLLGGLCAGVLVTWITFQCAVKPFYKHHRFLPLVTTIAWSMILDGVILLLFGEQPQSILPGMKHALEVQGAHMNVEQGILVLFTLVVLCGFAYMFHATAFGRRLRAVVQHDAAAMSLGVPAAALHRWIFLLSGFFAGAAGIFIGIDQNLSPTLAFSLTIKAYAAIIAGGKGNIWGAIACAYLIALLEQLLVGVHWFGAFYVPGGYQQTVALAFIMLIFLFRPNGLFPSRLRTA